MTRPVWRGNLRRFLDREASALLTMIAIGAVVAAIGAAMMVMTEH